MYDQKIASSSVLDDVQNAATSSAQSVTIEEDGVPIDVEAKATTSSGGFRNYVKVESGGMSLQCILHVYLCMSFAIIF